MTGTPRPESAPRPTGDNRDEWSLEDWRLNYEAVEEQHSMLSDAVARLDDENARLHAALEGITRTTSTQGWRKAHEIARAALGGMPELPTAVTTAELIRQLRAATDRLEESWRVALGRKP